MSRTRLHVAFALALASLAATPGSLSAAPDPPAPLVRENLPRVVANFLSKVQYDFARLLGIPVSVARGPDFVTRDVLLGPEPTSAKDYDRLHDLGVESVLDMRGEKADDAKALEERGVRYKRIEVTDYHAPTEEQLREGVEWMVREVAAGRRVYVHCAAGIGRSATVVAAFLMKEYGWSRERAWSFLEARRPIVKQTDDQRRVLELYEEKAPSRTRGASEALDRGFERRTTDRVRDLAAERVRDAKRDRGR